MNKAEPFNRLAQEIYEWAVTKGFYEPMEDEHLNLAITLMEWQLVHAATLEGARKGTRVHSFEIPEDLSANQKRAAMALILIISECAEAFEDVCKSDLEHEEEEVADIMIRLLDYAGWRGVDVDAGVERKMEINRGRPHKHGKAF